MLAGPKPLPLITKIAPCAIPELGSPGTILLAAFCTLVMAGAAETSGIAAEIRRRNTPYEGVRRDMGEFPVRMHDCG